MTTTSRLRRVAVAVAALVAALGTSPAAPASAADTVTCAASAPVLAVDGAGALWSYALGSPASPGAAFTGRIRIGTGWNVYGTVLAADAGWVYALSGSGMYLYHRTSAGVWDVQRRHFGYLADWAQASRAGRITVDQRGTIFVLTDAGAVEAYRFDSAHEGLVRVHDLVLEAESTRNLVVAAGDGVLYLRRSNGELDRVRYEATSDRILSVSRRVGSGWGAFSRITSPGGDVLLATRPDGRMIHYRYREDTRTWVVSGHQVGTGWHTLRQVSAGSSSCRLTTSFVPSPVTPMAWRTDRPGVVTVRTSRDIDAVTPDPGTGLTWARFDAVSGGMQQAHLLFEASNLVGTPSLTRLQDDRLSVLTTTSSSTMYGALQRPGVFGLAPATDEGGRMATSPTSAVLGKNAFHFAVDPEGRLWVKKQLLTSGEFLPWRPAGLSGLRPVSVSAWERGDGTVRLAVVASDGRLRLGTYDGTSITGLTTLATGVEGRPDVLPYPGWDSAVVAHRVADGRVRVGMVALTANGRSAPWVTLGPISGDPSLGFAGNGSSFVQVRGQSDDVLVSSESGPRAADWETWRTSTLTPGEVSDPEVVTDFTYSSQVSDGTLTVRAGYTQNGHHQIEAAWRR
ncbi:tachylectin-related carbohydrate-binding protein [Pedococcus sp. KACC 23699]|uniref:Tachylectin-related carbohydrate-binding protein n=1 Tax=Pedococcus sp. KACC 23699 TaxID=3149228 RepID=A0AAU7JQU8_9MICO